MAKFLPFVVAKSDPLHVFQTILSRSKGMNYGVISSIFHIVLKRGIIDIRAFADTLPDLPLENLYEEIINRFSQDRISPALLEIYTDLADLFVVSQNSRWEESLWEYDIKDVMIFMLVLSQYSKEALYKYTSLQFDLVTFDYQSILNHIQTHVPFADEGKPRQFANVHDLRTFILYHSIVGTDEITTPIFAVLTSNGGQERVSS